MNTFNLSFMLKVALKHWIAIVLAAVIAAAAGFGYCHYFRQPKYSAKGAIMVTNGQIIAQEESLSSRTNNERLEGADISASVNFLETVIDILKTPDIYKKLASEMGNEYSYGQLKGMFDISKKSEDSLFLNVSITTGDQVEAVKYLNSFLGLAPDYIKDIVKNTATYITFADSASIVQYSPTTVMMVSAFLAAVAVYAIFFIISSSDKVVRDEDGLREHFDVEIIGVVPDFANAKDKEYKHYKYGKYYGYGRYYGYGYGGKSNVSKKD